ncbi:hypothetical protein ACFLXY_11140 [Chloroflexota bacterium]
MERTIAICDYVIDGNTLVTDSNVKLRLARVNISPIYTKDGISSKMLLESLIADNVITFEKISEDANGIIISEVWVRGKNVNDAMNSATHSQHE